MKLSKFIFLPFIMTALVLTGCSKSQEKSDNTTKITATFYPLYIMLENITEGADNISLSMLAPANTGCLHDYQLTTRDMKALENCDILVANGAGMEDFLDKALQIKKDTTIIASHGYPLVQDNAHVWVSPKGAIYQVQQITEGLCTYDSKNSSIYIANCNKYVAELEALSNEMHSTLDAFKGSKVITFHEAFPYFADEFELDTVAVIEREAGTEPSAKELNDMIKLIKEEQKANGKIALFAEPQYSSSSAEVISKETGLTVGELDPGVTGSLDKDSYLKAMRANLKVLEKLL